MIQQPHRARIKALGSMLAALALAMGSAYAPAAFSAPICTVVVDSLSGKTLHREGPCDVRSSPASTFKIALALMGFATGDLQTPHAPVLPYQQSYKASMKQWQHDTDPTSWLRDSVVWYSQKLTQAMGLATIQQYLADFSYGNQDFRGEAGKHDGLTRAWLSSSLRISPDEQIELLRKIQQRQLSLPDSAYVFTQGSMPVFPVKEGWTLYGKTGNAYQRNGDGSINEDRQIGWFVGWATHGDRAVTFARLIKDEQKQPGYASLRARDSLLADLPAWLP